MCYCALGYCQLVQSPDSVGGVISFLLPELVECVVNGAAYFVTDLSELLTKGESSSAFIPVFIPLTAIQLISWRKKTRETEKRQKDSEFVSSHPLKSLIQSSIIVCEAT